MSEDNKPTSEEVRAKVIEKFGLDDETQGDLVNKLVNEQFDNHKELSKTVGRKKEYRQMLVDEGILDPKTFKPVKKKVPEGKVNKPNEDFNTGDIAFMEGRGVKTDDEMNFVKSMMDKTGENLKDTLSDDYVQSKLKTMKEVAAVKDATPSGSKRTPTSGKASVEYWLAKGGLPPESDIQLRRDVLNARIKGEERGNKFAPQSVISQLPQQ